MRRLRICTGTFTEPLLPGFPFDISKADLADALKMVSIFTYSIESYELGRFFDALDDTITSMAAHRLKEPEQWLP